MAAQTRIAGGLLNRNRSPALTLQPVDSSDCTVVVSVSLDGTARIWRADGAGDPAVLRGHDRGVVDAAFSPDGTHVVTASRDGTARIWRVGWEELLQNLRRNTQACLTPEQRKWFLAETQTEAWADGWPIPCGAGLAIRVP